MIDCETVLNSTFVRRADWHAELASTNTTVLRAAGGAGELPWLVGAERQSQGRGRGKNAWWSCSGSLTFSVLLEPGRWGISPTGWPLVSLATGLALSRAVDPLLPVRSQIKWPNDLYVGERKLAGILIESSTGSVGRLVIGIGLNVSNPLNGAPEDVRGRGVSLADLSPEVPDRTVVLIGVLKELEQALIELGEAPGGLVQACRERCLLQGQPVAIEAAEGTLAGVCQGIDDDGALRVLTESGPRRVIAGTVHLLR